LLLQLVVIGFVCALTALAAHLGRAVFNDGIRPILPEVSEGRMSSREMASLAYGFGSGWFFTVGITFALISKLLNPWLLFLPTDMIGILARRPWQAAGLGLVWGVAMVLLFNGIHNVLEVMPIPFVHGFGSLYEPVLIAMSLTPSLAVLYQFGKFRGISAIAASLSCGQLAVRLNLGITSETVHLVIGTIMLVCFVITESIQTRRKAKLEFNEAAALDSDSEQDRNKFLEKRLLKSLPLLMLIGGMVALISKLHFFAGTEAASALLPTLFADNSSSSVTAVGIGDALRHLAFIPFILVSAFNSGIYTVIVMSSFGYFVAPALFGPGIAGSIGAFVLGALEMGLLILAGRKITGMLEGYPVVREAADHIRNAFNQTVEIGLIIGSAIVAATIATTPEAPLNGFSFTVFVALFLSNEALGRPVVRIAAAPAAALAAGLVINLFQYIGLL
jgi:hypothetical protein